MPEYQPHSISELQDVVRGGSRLLARGGGSKTGLSNAAGVEPDDITVVDMRHLSGILEYEPGEYTITAQAGTPLIDVEDALAEHGQYLPFDPPLVERGATLGGTVAAGLSGSGRYRYGGVRDFLIGVRFVDGRGEVVRGGGKVVKNAAGFDLPKLMVGSRGRFGILSEVSFKVFPRPESYGTLCLETATLADAVDAMQKLAAAPFDIDALDLVPAAQIASQDGAASLYMRMGGLGSVLSERLAQLRNVLGGGERLTDADEPAFWRAAREFHWRPDDTTLVKTPTTPATLCQLEHHLADKDIHRRYAVGGNLGWIAWPGDVSTLDAILRELGLMGLVVLGAGDTQRLGVQNGHAFARRIKQALDPNGAFMAL